MKSVVLLIKSFIQKHQLPTAILLVILITSFLTSISMYIYTRSGASGLDLSRPGFTATRNEAPTDTSPTFSPTGSLTHDDLASFNKLFEEQREYVRSLGSFDDDVLSDEALGFVISTE